MPYNIEFNRAENYCYVSYEGAVGLADFKKVFLAYIDHPEFVRNMDVVIDFTLVDEMAPSFELLKFFEFQQAFEEKRGDDYRVIVVCNSQEAFSQVTDLSEYAKNMPYEVGVFMSREEAFKWMKEGK